MSELVRALTKQFGVVRKIWKMLEKLKEGHKR